MSNFCKALVRIYFLLASFGFAFNAQTFVTQYSEDFETIVGGTLITTIDFSFYGQGASVPTIVESSGNGAGGSNKFITTTELQNLLGIVKYFDLKTNKKYRFSNTVNRTIGLTSNPIRITRPSNNGNYHNRGSVIGTGNWEVFSVEFTALADENVQFVTVKQADGGIISLDNIKLEVEGIAWTGAVSTNWHDAGNWEGNQIPTQNDNVLIANVANLPIINDAEVRISSLEIADGAKLLVQNNKPLIVNGQLTGNTGYVELLVGSTLFADRIVGTNHIISELGNFSVNSIFQSHMVLQRQQPIPIYGKASDGLTVSVTLDGETKTTTASGGKWEVIFDAKEAGGGAINLSINGTDTYEFTDILMGDVWICGGQSNMGRNVSTFQSFPEFANVPGTYSNDHIRLTTIKVYESNEVQDDVQFHANWTAANPTSITTFSATGYFFGKYLQSEINVPIGLITVARGGTGMGSFMSLAALESTGYKNDYDFEAVGLTGPSTLYNTMVHPLTKQKIKGVIWYQGEHEAINNLQTKFATIFTTLINSWRDAWNRNDLPFIFTQLPGWSNVANNPIESISATVRQQQLNTWKALENTGMAVAIDGGMTTDVHPPNKEDVGTRLGLFAKKIAYGEEITYSGPTIREAVRVTNTNKAILKFKHFGTGIESRAIVLNIHGPEQYNLLADSIYGFELAGENKVFYRAKATIENDSIITVTHQNVAEPKWVRFGWANFPLTNLFNNVGLPASPFEQEIIVKGSDNSLSANAQLFDDTNFTLMPTLLTKGEQLQIESKLTDTFTVELRDTTGRLVQKADSKNNTKVLISTQNLTRGVYFVLLKSRGQTNFRRVLLQK